jgi:hypothetical protein
MNRSIMSRLIAFPAVVASVATAALVALATPAGAAAPALPKDTVVRIQASGIEGGWHEGRIGLAPNGCTMVYLNARTQGGYTSVSLKGAVQMQRKEGGGWIDVPVKSLARSEPRPCQEGDND